jgi:hypothetical protein
MLFILTKQRAHKLRELTRTSVSMWTDHSILFPSFHSTEWWNVTVPTMFGWRDGESTPRLNNGTLMVFPRP